MNTICAISTPIGNGAINIVRLSGKNSLPAALSLFSCDKLDDKNIVPRHFYLGNFLLEDGKEKCLMVYFKSPFSFTGEDMVEFQIHGGEFLAKKVLSRCLSISTVRQAEAGEFTKRAFLNGKISLDEAEGIIDEITAESEAELAAAFSLTEGKLHGQIEQLQSKLTTCLARCEVALDYPEHDEEQIATAEVRQTLQSIEEKLKEILKNSEQSRLFKEGIDVVLAGLPNVGKSSLLNALLGEDRAIVTNIAGTTRDIIREKLVLNGVKFNLIDTAGLRESEDIIEKMGIDKAKKAIQSSSLLLFVLDSSRLMTKEEKDYLSSLKGNILLVKNKCDEGKKENSPDGLFVSAKTGEGIEKLKELIFEKTVLSIKQTNTLQLTNERHLRIIEQAQKKIKEVTQELSLAPTMDILVFHVKQLWNELGKITGETETESIVDEIFSKFCLGK